MSFGMYVADDPGKNSGSIQSNAPRSVRGICMPRRYGRNFPRRVLVLSTTAASSRSFIISHAEVKILTIADIVKSIFTTSHINRSVNALMLNVFDTSFRMYAADSLTPTY